jgi:tRNA-Thr(GGU) m(6)t(6)A37 methyltransferase TsaA
MKIIARIYNDYKEKFGIPRQAGLAKGLYSKIVFEGEYRNPEALRGIEEYSHLWLIWEFSEAKREEFSPTVRPPRLGGNRRVGVFATRSPFRPNPIGLSSVRLAKVKKTESEGTVLIVEGADLMSGTPIYDIKPYITYTDSHPDATQSFAEEGLLHKLEVEIPEKLRALIPTDKLQGLTALLSEDPRPAYKAEGDAEYGMSFGDMEISFKVSGGVLTVTEIKKKTFV